RPPSPPATPPPESTRRRRRLARLSPSGCSELHPVVVDGVSGLGRSDRQPAVAGDIRSALSGRGGSRAVDLPRSEDRRYSGPPDDRRSLLALDIRSAAGAVRRVRQADRPAADPVLLRMRGEE